MAELKLKQKGDNPSPSIVRMKRNKFFRVIKSRYPQIEFPSEFVEEHGYKLPDELVLKVRTGDFWNIKVKKFGERIRTLRDAEIDYPLKPHKFKNTIHGGAKLGESTNKECVKNSTKNLGMTSPREDTHQRTEHGEPSVYRANEDMAPEDVPAPKQVSCDTPAVSPSQTNADGVGQRTGSFNSKYPFFKITMGRSYINQASVVSSLSERLYVEHNTHTVYAYVSEICFAFCSLYQSHLL
ncbi:hypothetical protein AQUCO_00100601v1 [Aquilegia coerulea]|uniref:Uncharacterized protein n=1 Tax=Aquilegia coerulea TaxID=218851 RepID=A0A2G5FB53_AQUCA|nr:hypothetical protein AQUCO_00100601v1 [Aquilegia coerulea]